MRRVAECKGGPYKFMHSKHVHLGQGVIDVEDFRKVVNSATSIANSEASLALKTSGGIDTDRLLLAVVLAVGVSFNISKVTECPGK